MEKAEANEVEIAMIKRSGECFWQRMAMAEERGHVSFDDIVVWAEWDLMAWVFVARALMYPLSAMAADIETKKLLRAKTVTRARLESDLTAWLENIVWYGQPGKLAAFMASNTKDS